MIGLTREFIEYRKYNKKVSRMLGIRRDIIMELFILFNPTLPRHNDVADSKVINGKILWLFRHSRGFMEYYERRNIIPKLEGLSHIICRAICEYKVDGNLSHILALLKTEYLSGCLIKPFMEDRINDILKKLEGNETLLYRKEG